MHLDVLQLGFSSVRCTSGQPRCSRWDCCRTFESAELLVLWSTLVYALLPFTSVEPTSAAFFKRSRALPQGQTFDCRPLDNHVGCSVTALDSVMDAFRISQQCSRYSRHSSADLFHMSLHSELRAARGQTLLCQLIGLHGAAGPCKKEFVRGWTQVSTLTCQATSIGPCCICEGDTQDLECALRTWSSKQRLY